MQRKIYLLILATMVLLTAGGCGSSSDPAPQPVDRFSVVTPSNIGADDVWDTDSLWHRVNLRADATLEISDRNPNNGNGSLEYTAVVANAGEDKADLQNLWDPATYPARTVLGLSALSYDFYRDSSSTIPAHFAPALRLVIYNPSDDSSAYLIWEPVYNGYPIADGGVPVDSWVHADIWNGNFSMYILNSDTGTGWVHNYNSTLLDWLAGTVTGDPGNPPPITVDSDTLIVGINIGIGSWWSTTLDDQFTGYVDNVYAAWDDDIFAANFEVSAP